MNDLFDFDLEAPGFESPSCPGPHERLLVGSAEGLNPSGPERSWNEVPQALFLSWSVPMQLAYCAARDEDTAAHTDCDVLGPEFYTARAAGYKEMLHHAV